MLLPLLTDQLSGQLDDHSTKPDHEASSQLLSNILEVLDRTDVVSPVTSYGLNLLVPLRPAGNCGLPHLRKCRNTEVNRASCALFRTD